MKKVNKVDEKITYMSYIKGIGAFLLFFIIPNIPGIVLGSMGVKVSNDIAMLIDTGMSISLAVILILIFKKSLIREFKTFKSKLGENIDFGFKCWFVGMLVMTASNLIINMFSEAGVSSNENAIQSMITLYPIIMLVQAGILAPIVEELVFRKGFRSMIKNDLIFVLASGLIFGYLHVFTFTSLIEFLYIIPYSALGVAFAYSYVKTKSVFTPMLLHFIHNFVLTSISIIGALL